MAADRWYYLRHPEGFSDDLLACVNSGLAIWRNDVEAQCRHWRHTGLKGEPPDYQWYPAELSKDRLTVTIPLGGKGTYGSYHRFEETIPKDFWRYLPNWFVLDLEAGRRDTAGWFPEVSWSPCYPPEKREAARTVFPRPTRPKDSVE
jgi:hypothetical protein